MGFSSLMLVLKPSGYFTIDSPVFWSRFNLHLRSSSFKSGPVLSRFFKLQHTGILPVAIPNSPRLLDLVGLNDQAKKDLFMPTLKRISAHLTGRSRVALAASLIWIPLAMGISAHAQTAEQESEQVARIAAPVIPQQVRYSGKLATRTGDIVEAVFSIYAAPEGGEPL